MSPHKRFDVVISFSGEDREIAEQINSSLKSAGVRTFYDADHEASLWGENLSESLHDIYANHGQYCLMILSRNYREKIWTRHERRSALSRAIREQQAYILPYIVDDSELSDFDGLNPDIAYLSMPKFRPIDVTRILASKLKGPYLSFTNTALANCMEFIMRNIDVGSSSNYGDVSRAYYSKFSPVFNIAMNYLVEEGLIRVGHNSVDLGMNLTIKGSALADAADFGKLDEMVRLREEKSSS